MLKDLAALEAEATASFDVCVIGAGPAGISLALELAKKNRRVALCEAGGQTWSEASQSCYRGKVIGDPYFQLDQARLRYFGGTSGHWAGWCRQLDHSDFLRKSFHALAHWPITERELDPYFQTACEILHIHPPRPDIVRSERFGIKNISFSFSPPVRFGQKYFKPISESGDITLFLNANLTRIVSADGKVSECLFHSFNNNKLVIKASNFVLAMGGIENSRQLLYQQQQCHGKLHAPRIPVGRYWMEHPIYSLGEALVDQRIVNQMYFALTPEKRAQLSILNCGLRIEGMKLSRTKGLIKELMCVAPALAESTAGLLGKRLVCGVTIKAAWEQSPEYANRVELSQTQFDHFGIPTTELHWKKVQQDRDTVFKTVVAFNDWLMEADLGRLKLAKWLLQGENYPANDELAGFHHMGGTRMSESPEFGVVDSNCKVFGSRNLYVAGSSVFPSGGHANPTLTIVQLALRLADHLSSTHGSGLDAR